MHTDFRSACQSTITPGRSPRTEPGPAPREFLSLQEAAPLVREELVRAVRRLVQHADVVTADLSGRIDSSTITALAASTLKTETVPGLLAVTYVDRSTVCTWALWRAPFAAASAARAFSVFSPPTTG